MEFKLVLEVSAKKQAWFKGHVNHRNGVQANRVPQVITGEGAGDSAPRGRTGRVPGDVGIRLPPARMETRFLPRGTHLPPGGPRGYGSHPGEGARVDMASTPGPGLQAPAGLPPPAARRPPSRKMEVDATAADAA